jgi:hypothetical protein
VWLKVRQPVGIYFLLLSAPYECGFLTTDDLPTPVGVSCEEFFCSVKFVSGDLPQFTGAFILIC